MAAPFGSPTGPLYPLGAITVATPGTPVLLSQNVPITTSFGTSASPAPIVANQLILSTPSTNTGMAYLLMSSGTKNLPNSIVVALAPGWIYALASPQLSNPFQLTNFLVDADTAANKVQITAVIV